MEIPPRESLKQVLMRRDNLTSDEADDTIAELQNELDARLADGDTFGAMDVCEIVGLEPDYVEDLVY